MVRVGVLQRGKTLEKLSLYFGVDIPLGVVLGLIFDSSFPINVFSRAHLSVVVH